MSMNQYPEKLKFIFFGFPAHGHTNPTLALVSNLIKFGHTVSYMSKEIFREAIEKTGADFLEYKSESLEALSLGLYQADELQKSLLLTAAELLPDLFTLQKRQGFDAVIYDAISGIWGQIFAEKFKLPAIGSCTTFLFRSADLIDLMPQFMPKIDDPIYLSAFAYMKQNYDPRLETLKDVIDLTNCVRADFVLTYSSAELQPYSEYFKGESFLYQGNRFDRVQEQTFASLDKENALVYISLGTIYNTDVNLLRFLINSFKSEYKLIVSAGGNVETYEQLKDLNSPKVQVLLMVDQQKVLRDTALFVSHGGMNSVYEGIYYTVPMLLLPQIEEQRINALRVQELKGAYLLDSSRIEEDLVKGFNEIKSNWLKYKKALGKMRESFLASDNPSTAAKKVEKFVCSFKI